MYKKPFDPNEAIVVISNNEARIIVGQPTRSIAADDLNEDDLMALTNFSGVNIDSSTYMPDFEVAFVNMLLRWAQPVYKDDIYEYVIHYFGGQNAAKTKALEYLDYLKKDQEPDQLILDQVIDSLIWCYTEFEGWATQGPDGTICLTKGGKAIREAKFGTTKIKTIE